MEGFIVDPRKSGPEEFQKGMRDVKLVFAINHTMPYTEEYDALVKELFVGKIGEGSRRSRSHKRRGAEYRSRRQPRKTD